MTDVPIISSLKELLNEISYNWDYPRHDFIKFSDGYVLNKLYIERDRVTYKTSSWILADGVYEEFECYYNFLLMIDRGHNYDHDDV